MLYLLYILVGLWPMGLLAILAAKLAPIKTRKDKHWPFVSILIAVRNEESNIIRLCEHLNRLSYPKDKFEILIGDDASSDKTPELLKLHRPENAIVHHFTEAETGQYGKQKVLSTLSNKAKGTTLMFTDADMSFGPNWIQGMLHANTENDQLVVGLTRVEGTHWLARMQHLEWMYNEWYVQRFAQMGIYLTAWGNNMLMTKGHYQAAGGHDRPFTLLEDVKLLDGVIRAGGKLVVNTKADAVASTLPLRSFKQLISQRKRWMKGVSRLHPLLKIGLVIKMLFWPVLACCVFLNSWWLILGGLVLMVKYFMISRVNHVVNGKVSAFDTLVFEGYDFVFYLVTFAFYLLPVRTFWKGRSY